MKKEEGIYMERLDRHHDELRWLYMELYDNDSMFAELCDTVHKFYLDRDKELKGSDQRREKNPGWYKQNDMLGMMLMGRSLSDCLISVNMTRQPGLTRTMATMWN